MVRKSRHGGLRQQLMSYPRSGSIEHCLLLPNSFHPFIQSRTPTNEMMLPTFRMDLPLGKPLWKKMQIHVPKVCLDNFIITITQHPGKLFTKVKVSLSVHKWSVRTHSQLLYSRSLPILMGLYLACKSYWGDLSSTSYATWPVTVHRRRLVYVTFSLSEEWDYS